MTAMREIASGLQFPEGPIAMSDGSVILVEIQRGTLSKVDPEGRVEVIGECGGGPNGAAIGPDGAVPRRPGQKVPATASQMTAR